MWLVKTSIKTKINNDGMKLVKNNGYDDRSIPKWITQVGFTLPYNLMEKIVHYFPSIVWFQKLDNESIKLYLVKPNQTKVLKRKKERNGKYLIKLEQTNKWMDRSEIVHWTYYAFSAKSCILRDFQVIYVVEYYTWPF